MNPTPEQVAQWAREAGAFFDVHARGRSDGILLTPLELQRFATLAMAEQAELCAKTADGYVCAVGDEAYCVAAAIRANAPKVTT